MRRSPSRRWPRSFWLSARRRAGASKTARLVLVFFLALGLGVGLLVGGRPAALDEVRFRWWALAIGGLFFQVALFAPPVARAVAEAGGGLGPILYVGSTVAVLAALVRNIGQPWFPMIALGAGLNLLVIIVNGGVMPADPDALAAAGLLDHAAAFSNTMPLRGAPLAELADNFATPAWLPFANVLSIGDLLIGMGAAAWLATTLRRSPAQRLEGHPVPA